MVAGRELDALVAEKVMGMDVRGWALAYIDEMSCWCIEHPDKPERGTSADLRAVYTRHPLETVCFLDKLTEEERAGWRAGDEDDLRREFARDVAAWGTSHHRLEAVPGYSTDISAAWEVVEKMEANGYCPSLVNDDHGHWAMSFEGESPITEKCPWVTVHVDEVEWADTAPHAICLAASTAVAASLPEESRPVETTSTEREP